MKKLFGLTPSEMIDVIELEKNKSNDNLQKFSIKLSQVQRQASIGRHADEI